MPPQTDESSTSSDPNDFDFMLKQQSEQKKRFGWLSKLNTPAKLLIAAATGLIIAIITAAILGGGQNSGDQVIGLMAQNQEIVRVSQAQEQKFKDQDTKDLSATTQAVMSSQKFQFGIYLGQAEVKYSPQQLSSKMDEKTDTDLQTAAQNNDLDQAYTAYLKNSLTTYLNSLSSLLQTTNSQSLKDALQSARDSIQTLLNSPQFKS